MDWNENDGVWSDDFDTGKIYKSDHSIDEQAVRQRAIKRKIENDKLALIVAKRLEDLCKEPAEGEQWRIITEKSFNAFALIMHVIQTRTIEELEPSLRATERS